MSSKIVNTVKDYVCEILQNLKKQGYMFHNLDHTLDVFTRVTYLAKKENIGKIYTEIVELSALFHDVGFLVQYDGHEKIGINILTDYIEKNPIYLEFFETRLQFSTYVEKYFKTKKFTQDRIKIINQIILATIPFNQPNNKLEMIIKDADLDNLGREDFFHRGEQLRQELLLVKQKNFTDLEWYTNINKFISNLKYYTSTQQEERNKTFIANKNKLTEIIKKLGG